jgi:hypothetical protein
MSKGGTPPKSILISWKPEGEDFLDMSFGEEWMDADADFTNVLNKLGEEFGIGGGGTGMGKAINMIPLPGFTEGLQRDFLKKLGILDDSGNEDKLLPSGNPNLIKIAKKRKTIGYGQAGSGLKCDVSIKMVVEYEQKFISGIDPTIAWMDIINNILVFGTSKSTNYGLSPKFKEKLNTWTQNPSELIKDIVNELSGLLEGIKSKLASALKSADDDRANAIAAKSGTDAEKAAAQAKIDKKKAEEEQNIFKDSKKALSNLISKIGDSVSAAVRKYRIEIMGIANALSGSPSTPWHITIGNPLRPVFCSGDMYISDNVKLTLGSTLAFNDLPSTIKVEFTLTNARPWGLQEILAKFNTGHLRTINIQKDFLELENQAPGGVYMDNSIIEEKKSLEGSGQSSSSQGSNTGTASVPQTKENAE